MKNSYLLKHWMYTSLLGPFISQIIIYFYGLNPNKIAGLLEVYPVSLIFSLLFSAPTYILFSFGFTYLKKKMSILMLKIIFISFIVIGVICTANLIGGKMTTDIIVSYTIAAILTGILTKTNYDNNKNHHKLLCFH